MAQRPDPQSFPLSSGDYVQLEFTVTDNDAAAVNLTGGTGRFAMARTVDDTAVIDSDSSPQTATVTVVGASTGRVDVIIDDADTEALVGEYYYEFKWTDSTGKEAVVAWGYIAFAKNLT
jgi:hypothetical protein